MQRKQFIIVGILLIGILIGLFFGTRSIVLHSFFALERQETLRNVERAENALAAEMKQLSTTTGDYAGWDEAYQFVQHGSPDFVKINLDKSIYEKLRLNLLVFCNRSGNIVYGRAYDYRRQQELPLSAAIRAHLQPGKPLLQHPSPESAPSGYLSLPEGLMLVVSRPILTSEYQGPIMGTLITGRFLDTAEITQLGERTRLSLYIDKIEDARQLPSVQKLLQQLPTPEAIAVQAPDNQHVFGARLLADLYGTVSGLLRVELPRQIYHQGQVATLYFLWLYGVTSILFLVIFTLFSRKLLLAQDRYNQHEIELSASEQRYRLLAEHATDQISRHDLEGRFLFASPTFFESTGYTPEELLGQNVYGFFHPEDITHVREAHTLILTTPVTTTISYRFRHKAGHYVWAESKCKSLPTPDSAAGLEVIAITREITERKETEAALLRAKEAADAANFAKSRFLATMSHEIRTPMNGVIGMTELLLTTELTAEQRSYAEVVKLSGDNLLQLIDAILDLSRIEAKRIELASEPFDLGATVTETIAMMSLLARAKGLDLRAEFTAEVPCQLRGDAGRLRQILLNLIGNAIKFTPCGSVLLLVGKESETPEQVTLRFMVRDTGIGIASDKQEQIFAPFTQEDSSTTRQYGGSGLGLAITKQLVTLMGGEIGLESHKGTGSTFWFTVVMARGAAMARPSPPESTGRQLNRSPGHRNQRLLLAEDDQVNRFLIQSILKRAGFEVDMAENGQEALQLLAERDYALVLMDCMMPVVNGYDATAIIREPNSAVRDHTIPIIALTANVMREDRSICLAAGMDDYLSKPFLARDLLAMVEKWQTKTPEPAPPC